MDTNINFYFSNDVIFFNNKGKLEKLHPKDYKHIKILTYMCPDKSIIPNTLNDLEELYFYQNIDEIPPYFPKLKTLYCNNTGVKTIPDTFNELEYLDCSHNLELKELPEKYKKIKTLKCKYTQIKLD